MSSFNKINLRLIALLVIPSLLVAESGMADARVGEAPSETVRYQDLNLDSRDGIATLYGRIQAAAVDVCRSVEGSRLVTRVFWTEWHGCINHAVAKAVGAVRNENLSAYRWEQIRGWKPRLVATRNTAATH